MEIIFTWTQNQTTGDHEIKHFPSERDFYLHQKVRIKHAVKASHMKLSNRSQWLDNLRIKLM